jgi:S1-C subfamily serine protease
MTTSIRAFVLLTSALVLASFSPGALADDLAELQDQAVRAAVERVGLSVVQIETSAGADTVGLGQPGQQIRTGLGPTTGLVVSADGYIISSAFNFANKPGAVFVAIPGRKDRLVAQVVATDHTRMLTLLKVPATGLPVPAATPKKEIHVGQTAVALGRTWSGPEGPPSVSVGIVSALNRIWGKAIQTDAKVSPVNYGGPLMDIQGRVMGILVPASPQAQDETAGVEWYDSGIGFAIPLEDVNAILPRLKQGHDLHRGYLGITSNAKDLFGAEPVVVGVVPNSTAAKAGIKAGDVIVEIAGTRLTREAQLQQALGNKYEGEVVSVKIRRGKEEINLGKLTLSAELPGFSPGFLGILPMRDDPEQGVEVRYVYPKSAAETAGIKAGDRILTLGSDKVAPRPFVGRDQFLTRLMAAPPGTEIKLGVRHKDAKEPVTLTAKLGDEPSTVPAQLPQPASLKKAKAPRNAGARPSPAAPPKEAKPETKKEDKKAAPEKKAETGLLHRRNEAGDREYWLYVPANYDPNIAYALVVWLHPAGQGRDKDAEPFIKAWEKACGDEHVILVGPRAQNETGWLASEADLIQETVREVMSQYTVDAQRIVAHGPGSGGQMAFYLGFHARELFHGVAPIDASLGTAPPENAPGPRLAFFLVTRAKGASAAVKSQLAAKKYAVIQREVAGQDTAYLDAATQSELARWIDSLDHQ